MSLISLNLEVPKMRADYESNAPTGVPISDVAAMEQMLLGVRTQTGQAVTPERARRCSAVLACMRGISEDLSGLPLKLYKRGPNGDEEAVDHPVYKVLNGAPNEIMLPIEVREHMLFDLFLWGNFYNLITESDTGDVESIWPLQAGYVVRRWRELYWTYTDPLSGVSGNFTPETVWRGTLLSANGLDGQALTLLAREAIGLLLAAEEQGARLFSQGVQTDFVLTSDEEIADKDQLRASLMARHAGTGNSWLPLLLEGGIKAEKIGLTAQESQYIEARKFQIEDVARVFRYPSVLLGIEGGKSSTYASAEQFFNSYTKHTLLPYAIRLEQTVQRDLLKTKEKSKYYAKHDFDQLLRADQAARFDNWNKGISGGWLQPAEARRKEGLPYKPGLDYFNRAKNMDSLGGSPESAPTDQSAVDGLPRRVAAAILRREHKALAPGKQDANLFYSTFGGYIEDLTGADSTRVLSYLEMRRATADRFTTEAQDAALAVLISLCKKDS